MTQVFRPRANTVTKLVLVGVPLALATAAFAAGGFYWSSYVTGVGTPLAQPVPFSHQHHVAGLGIDCRYCHQTAETSSYAGMPATETCMNCHAQVWTNAAVLAPVRDSLRTGEPLRWRRVNALPGYVYFDHSVHVRKGVGCVSCHGRVDTMPITWKAETLRMRWCLDCHRDPAPNLRPREAVTDMNWRPPPDRAALGRHLAREYDVKPGTDCTTCHR